MNAPSRGGALTAGLILIALGAIFLAETFYAHFSAWRLLSRYWPVVLIIIGIRKIYAYFACPVIPPPPGNSTRKE
jgi:hypothetical protein